MRGETAGRGRGTHPSRFLLDRVRTDTDGDADARGVLAVGGHGYAAVAAYPGCLNFEMTLTNSTGFLVKTKGKCGTPMIAKEIYERSKPPS